MIKTIFESNSPDSRSNLFNSWKSNVFKIQPKSDAFILGKPLLTSSIACNQWRNKRICGFKRPCLSFAFERKKFFLRCETFFKKHPFCKIWLRGFHLLKSKINKKLLNITDKANRFWPPTEFVKPALSVMSLVYYLLKNSNE